MTRKATEQEKREKNCGWHYKSYDGCRPGLRESKTPCLSLRDFPGGINCLGPDLPEGTTARFEKNGNTDWPVCFSDWTHKLHDHTGRHEAAKSRVLSGLPRFPEDALSLPAEPGWAEHWFSLWFTVFMIWKIYSAAR
jgi:hypothetical protein